MTAYYNEIDPAAAQWLRNLIAAGLIAPGDVDERSIEDVPPDDLRGYTQCHFFAGIGVWSYALRQAGWPDDRPVWTGSCPCQPFSSAGAQAGFDDERHLWPHFQWLIEQCRPAVVFGEQVASKAVEPWIDLVQTDLEGLGYAFAGIPFPSAGVGAPHIRDRLFWVADASCPGSLPGSQRGVHSGQEVPGPRYGESERQSAAGGLGHPRCAASERNSRSVPRKEAQVGSEWQQDGRSFDRLEHAGPGVGGMADAHGGELQGVSVLRGAERDGEDTRRAQGSGESRARGEVLGLADSDGERRGEAGNGGLPGRETERAERDSRDHRPGPTNGFWADADWLLCRDGKWRPVEPGTFPLVDGAPARVVRLRAYGNAINAEAAREFIESVMECIG